ncbi:MULTISPECIES: outer membrane protein assembly factor BamB [unclassified Thioalkalivibrio]|uniref:outer membrane protein assembly factor BamB n=1 Tax=unclassified Thioalkalivibrio TaxID=2621013 RepID=UPI00035F5CD4|nr:MULTISPECIES: outer membrane protein assembly factor BamB [unclassified Thioalkalivibrio]
MSVPVPTKTAVRLLIAGALMLSLSACGLWQRDTTEPPADLPEFEAEAQPEQLWSRSVGSGGERFLWQVYPGVADDMLVVVDADGRVSGLNPETGSQRWRVRLDDARVSAGVGVGDEIAVVGTLDGEAIAVDLQGDGERWRSRLSSEVVAISDVASGVVIARTNDGRVHALDAASGATQWTALRTTPSLSLRGAHRPQMTAGRVLTGFDNGRVVMLGLERGNVLWETTLGIPTGRSEVERMVDVDGYMPIYQGAAIASGYQGRLAAIDLNSGEIFWARDFSSYQGGDVTNEANVLAVTDAESHLWGLDPRNGADLWQSDQLRLRGVTAPVVVGDYAIVGDYEGYLHWFHLEDGRIVARLRASSGAVVTRPVLVDDILYVVTDNGRLTAVNPRLDSGE